MGPAQKDLRCSIDAVSLTKRSNEWGYCLRKFTFGDGEHIENGQCPNFGIQTRITPLD
jgi:hypothetical protein